MEVTETTQTKGKKMMNFITKTIAGFTATIIIIPSNDAATIIVVEGTHTTKPSLITRATADNAIHTTEENARTATYQNMAFSHFKTARISEKAK